MTKRQLIDEIVALNQTAQPAFLARFQDPDLHAYLEHLKVAQSPRLSGDPGRYEKYFSKRQTPAFKAASYGMTEKVDLAQTELAERAALLGKTELPQEDTDGSPEMTLQETTPALDPQPAAKVQQAQDQAAAEDVVRPDEHIALGKMPVALFDAGAVQEEDADSDSDDSDDADLADEYVSDVKEAAVTEEADEVEEVEEDEADDLDGSQYEEELDEADELEAEEAESSEDSQHDNPLLQSQAAPLIAAVAQERHEVESQEDAEPQQQSTPFAKAKQQEEESESWLF